MGGTIPDSLGKFLATWSTLTNAAFAYTNVQIVGMSGSESIDSRRSIPKAVKRTFIRLSVFYVLTILVLGMVLPNDYMTSMSALIGKGGTAASAPFVVAIKAAGIRVLPGIVNAVVMSSAFSSVCMSLLPSLEIGQLGLHLMLYREFLVCSSHRERFWA